MALLHAIFSDPLLEGGLFDRHFILFYFTVNKGKKKNSSKESPVSSSYSQAMKRKKKNSTTKKKQTEISRERESG